MESRVSVHVLTQSSLQLTEQRENCSRSLGKHLEMVFFHWLLEGRRTEGNSLLLGYFGKDG